MWRNSNSQESLFTTYWWTSRAASPPPRFCKVCPCRLKLLTVATGLQSGYPFPKTDCDKGVQKLLGEINLDICKRASKALTKGDAEELGRLMNEAQAAFDKYAQPACPSQLTMPLLHKAMNYGPLQEHIYGAKGVGSQGDGTAQFLCKSEAAQDIVMKALEDAFGMPSLKLSLSCGPQINNALIPAAGFGANNFPATKTMKSELFPVVTADGTSKPAILVNVECLVKSGVKNIFIIVQVVLRCHATGLNYCFRMRTCLHLSVFSRAKSGRKTSRSCQGILRTTTRRFDQ